MIPWLLAAANAAPTLDATGARVDGAGAERVVVVSGGVTEAVFALGLGDRVVGVDATSTWPPEVRSLPHVGYYRQLSAEGLLAFAPDLVVLPDDAGPPAVVDQLRRAGVSLLVVPGGHGADGARARLRLLGAALDRVSEAEALITSLDGTLGSLVPVVGAPRVLFVYARGAGTLQVAGQDTAADAMLQLVGAQNAVDGYAGYRPLTAEALVVARPDVLLLTTDGLAAVGGVAGVLAQPGVSATPAGRAGRVVALDDLLLLGFGPRTGEAAVALSAALSP